MINIFNQIIPPVESISTLPVSSITGTDTSIPYFDGTNGATDTSLTWDKTTSVLTAKGFVTTGVIALPTGDDIVTGETVRLISEDTASKASPGLYMSFDSTTFVRIGGPDTPYGLGAMSGANSLVAISGVVYEITSVAAGTSITEITLPIQGECRLIVHDVDTDLSWPGAWSWQTDDGDPPTMQATGIDIVDVYRDSDGDYWAWHIGGDAD